MQNLEQIRARHVLQFALDAGDKVRGNQGGGVIKKIPTTIMNHGLLAALAYSFSEREGWKLVFNAIAKHLSSEEIRIIPAGLEDRIELLNHLTNPNTSSETLKLATDEAMKWLEYARRFVQ